MRVLYSTVDIHVEVSFRSSSHCGTAESTDGGEGWLFFGDSADPLPLVLFMRNEDVLLAVQEELVYHGPNLQRQAEQGA